MHQYCCWLMLQYQYFLQVPFKKFSLIASNNERCLPPPLLCLSTIHLQILEWNADDWKLGKAPKTKPSIAAGLACKHVQPWKDVLEWQSHSVTTNPWVSTHQPQEEAITKSYIKSDCHEWLNSCMQKHDFKQRHLTSVCLHRLPAS